MLTLCTTLYTGIVTHVKYNSRTATQTDYAVTFSTSLISGFV